MKPGVNFQLTPEQQMIDESVRRFLAESCNFSARAQRLADPAGFDAVLWRRFADLGWLGLEIPEAYGGAGLSAIETLLLMHGFGRELVTEPYLARVVLGAGIVLDAGSEAQRRHLLPGVAAGSQQLAFGFAEPQGRYDAADVATTARPEGSGWRLQGKKCVVLGAQVAGTIVISARTSGAQRDRSGLSLFLLPSDVPGLSLRPYRTVDGHIAADTLLDDVRLGADALLGEANSALPAIERTLDRAATAIVAEAAGAMERTVELTRDYLKVRTQYGQPLAAFQVLRHRLVDMYIATEETRSLAYWAAGSLGGADDIERKRAVSSAKAHAGECGRLVGQNAVQLHGGMGIVDEFPIGHYLKRLTAIDRLFGDRMFHLDRYASIDATA